MIQWCNICNERPSDGKLTVEIEGQIEVLEACKICVRNPKLVQFDNNDAGV